MEWFIKQNSTLPIFQVEISKNGRSDFNFNQNLSDSPNVYLSLYDSINQVYRVTSSQCYITSSASTTNSDDITYYVNYQFTNRETKKTGRFELQLSIKDDYDDLVLPLSEKIYVNVIDSFSIENNTFETDYLLNPPCCNGTSGLPSPTVIFAKALLFIEPLGSHDFVANFMTTRNSTFYGFSNGSVPTQDSHIIDYMEMFSLYGGNSLPNVIKQDIPQESGGVDEYGNNIVQNNFKTTQVPIGTVNGPAWYTWVIPSKSIGDGKQTKIEYSTLSPNILLVQNMNNTIYEFSGIYTGLNFTPSKYSLYTTFQSHNFNLNNNVEYIYFKGNTVE